MSSGYSPRLGGSSRFDGDDAGQEQRQQQQQRPSVGGVPPGTTPNRGPPRLGDTLLRKVSPAPASLHGSSQQYQQQQEMRTPSGEHHHPYSARVPSSGQPQSQDQGRSNPVSPATAKSPQQQFSSTMGPPAARHGAGRSSMAGQTLAAPEASSSPVADRNGLTLPALPSFSSSLHAPLFDKSGTSTPQSPSSPLEEMPPNSRRRDLSAGTLPKRRPDMKLGLDQPAPAVQEQPSQSRFSAFSSATHTPDVSEGADKVGSGSYVSPSTAMRAKQRSRSPSGTGLSAGMSGLGLGLPSSMPNRATGSNSLSTPRTRVPQTPDRRQDASPRPSPSGYDRTGQIGLGELSTPRWNNFSQSRWDRQTSSQQAEMESARKPKRLPSDSRDATAQRHSRAISLTSSLAANNNNYTQRRPSGAPSPGMVASPSMPAVNQNSKLAGMGSISSLTRDFGNDPTEYMRSLQEIAGGSANSPPYSISARSEDSEGSVRYSGTDTDDLAGLKRAIAQSRSNQRGQDRLDVSASSFGDKSRSPLQGAPARSPRIGDLPWTIGDETGPFAVDSSTNAVNSEAVTRSGSFDLHAAISDLLKDDEERRAKRRELNVESSDDEEDAQVQLQQSSDAALAARQTSSNDQPEVVTRNAAAAPTPAQTRKSPQPPPTSSFSAEDRSRQPSIESKPTTSTTTAAKAFNPAERAAGRSRHASSPGQVVGSHKSPLPPLPSDTGTATASPLSARSSYRSSLGHTLLKGGHVPYGGDENPDAAEAMRKLDGISASSRRRSGSRERTPGDSSSIKSPRASKSYSRPSSAGKGASGQGGGNSRPSSPASRAAASQQRNELAAAARADRQRASEDLRTRRLSRNSNLPPKAKHDEAAGTASPKGSLDSPSAATMAYASPRPRKSALPPLPTGLASSPAVTPMSNKIATTPATTNIESPVTNTPPTSASRASFTGKTNRASDASSHFSATGDTSQRSASMEDEEERSQQVPAHLQRSAPGLVIPPVPPLPKAWETVRASSSSGDQMQPQTQSQTQSSQVQSQPSTQAPQQLQSQPPPHPYLQSQEHAQAPAYRGEQAGFGTESPNVSGGHPSIQGTPGKWSVVNVTSALEGSPLTTKSAAEDLSQTLSPSVSMSPTRRHRQQSIAASSDTADTGSKHTGPDSSSSPMRTPPPVKATAPSPARRTPSSFFRKKSIDSSHAANANADAMSPSLNQNNNKTPATPGRSSRKSILGLGNLLKGGGLGGRASRKSFAAADADVDAGHGTNTTSTTADSVESIASASQKSQQQQQSSSKLTKPTRRGSLIGRKRGKTLPSSTEPPNQPANVLPPMQVTPIQPASILRRTPSQTKFPGAANSQDESPRRRLVNSNSTSDLQGRSTRGSQSPTSAPAANAQSTPAQGRHLHHTMPTIHDSSPANQQATVSARDAKESSGPGETSIPIVSRIPRATGSVRRTPLRATAGSNTGPASSSGTGGVSEFGMLPSSASMKNMRLSGPNTTSALPVSKSSASSLAANFGIGPEGDESAGGNKDVPQRVRASAAPAPAQQATTAPAPALSASIQSILNAYNNASSASEATGAIRRARILGYSNVLSTADREALTQLFARHDQTQPQQQTQPSPSESTTAAPPVVKAKVTEGVTPRSVRQPSSSTSNAPGIMVPGPGPAVPRRVRASVTANTAKPGTTVTSRSPAGSRAVSRASPSTTALESRSTSAASTVVDEDERAGDEEMEAYIRRSHAKKLASGASQESLDKMLRFPEPEPPAKAYSPRQAEALYGNQLSDFELEEMFEYPEVYYVGNPKQKVMATKDKPSSNHGYDDERGDYIVVDRDHLAYRYEIVGTLGRGSFGQVLQCKDHKTGRSVAIKLIRNKKRFHHQALVEVKILQNLVDWDPHEQHNVIKMTDSFYFRNHLCISMELLSINLYELIKANSFAGFSTALIKRFTSQVLQSLSLMRHHRVVHCDLKPENILLRHPRKSGIKVIDFGSSCFEHEKVYTYIQSRFYRSPEVILGMNYHTAIDIWSLGCILAELFTGYPLFPGENEQEQLACIMEVLGVPDRYLIERSSRKKLFFDSTGSPRPYVSNKGKRRRPATKTLSQALRCNDELFLDFLARCLIWDPERRLKPEAALRHAFVRGAGAGANTHTITAMTPSRLPAAAAATSSSGSGSSHHTRKPSLSMQGASNGHAVASASNVTTGTAGSSGGTSRSMAGAQRSSMAPASSSSAASSTSGAGAYGSARSTRRTSMIGGNSGAANMSSSTAGTGPSTASLRRNQQAVS